jgi:hypothetical protein
MNELVFDIEQAIVDLAVKAAHLNKFEAPDQRPAPPPGWWVLAVGEELHDDSLSLRDQARERLRLQVRHLDLHLREHVWVWDQQNRAQLVLRTFSDRGTAEAYAAVLKRQGLEVRVTREWPQDKP